MSRTRTNAEVAAVFQEIADILDRQGENPFKIKAYRNAVRTLHELNEPVADIAARGELRQDPRLRRGDRGQDAGDTGDGDVRAVRATQGGTGGPRLRPEDEDEELRRAT